MIKLHVSKSVNSDFEVVFLDSPKYSKLSKNELSVLNLQGFKGKHKEFAFLQSDNKFYYALSDFSVDNIREGAANVIRALKKYEISNFKVEGFGVGDKNYALMVGFLLGSYEFDTYKTTKSKNKIKDIYIVESKSNFKNELNMANVVCESVNFVREIVNTPPYDCTPVELANIATKLAKDNSLKCKIGDVKFLQKEKMNALLSVARASTNEPRLIHLTYEPSKPKKTIVVVGKGLTYDSGGLSLKPADYMTTMKADKSGGCAVLGIMKAISILKPNIKVHGVVGATENMIGGNAYKPDDIINTREGVSVEVKNTDAEGRLVLADCLSYAQDLKPDYIIDLATLTGACAIALGEYTGGVMGFNTELNKKFESVALASGELASILPFNRHLEKLIESKNADINNTGSVRQGGAITAGLFLGKFIRDDYKDKWVHFDIAGPAFVEHEWDVNSFGASGVGVRSVVDFILSL